MSTPPIAELALGIFANNPEGLLVVDPNSLRIAAANDAAHRILGFEPDTIVGREITTVESSIENLFYWDDAQHGNHAPVAASDGYYCRNDGQIISVQKRIDLLQLTEQAFLLISFHETAGSSSLQDELSHSASLLASTLEATADGILVTRLDCGISNMNQRFAQMWRIPEELLDAAIDEAIYDHLASETLDPELYRKQLATALLNTDEYSLDTIELKDGRFFERYLTPLYSDGRASGNVFSFRDVTDRKHAEAEHAHYELALHTKNQQLEIASRVKSEFLANMSHEIRTPMTAIIGFARLCLATELNPQQRDYVAKIFQSGESLLGIINDILDFSKIEAGKLSIESVPLRLADVIKRVANLTTASAEAKGLTLTFDTTFDAAHADLNHELFGDPLRLGQVLLNLVSNAIKFTDQGSIRVGMKLKTIADDKVVLEFSVADTGIGMSPEECSRMFQSFSQADASTTRKYGGTGLGLAICKSLVALMQGAIELRSERGVGTIFSFTATFTRDRQLQETTETHGDHNAPWKIQRLETVAGARVLVVEDNKINQQIATELLKHAGLDVTIANNGLEGLVLVEQQSFDAVLMDIQMPVMDGFETTAAIRAHAKFATLPIIAMTANTMSGDDQRCFDAGMNDHVSKPIDPDKLFSVLMKWIAPTAHREPPPERAALTPASDIRLPENVFGIDIATALKRAGGNRELVRTLLSMFVRDHSNDADAIRQALAVRDYTKAQRIAHTFKGIAGSIGANALESLAGTLDTELRTRPGDNHSERLSEFSVALSEVVAGVATFTTGASTTATALAARSDRRSILVVDDEPMIVTVLSAILNADYNVASASSGEEALQAIALAHPDLILLDITMSDMDGYAVCRRLKGDAATKSIPVVFVTGSDNIEDRLKGFSAGAVDYLPKPIKRDLVNACVRKHVAKA